MENANSKEYLDKIKIQVIENLKQTAHAPSVQMTAVPSTTLNGGREEDDDIADDLDDDLNKDARMTEYRYEKRVTRDDEFDESDDEGEARANGIQSKKTILRRNNTVFRPTDNIAIDIEMDSGIEPPEIRPEVDAMVTALATEANAEVNAEVMEQKSRSLTAAAADAAEVGPSNAPSRAHSPKDTKDIKEITRDNDGDVEMGEMKDPIVTEPSAASAPAPLGQWPEAIQPTPLSPAVSAHEAVAATVEPVVQASQPTEPAEIKKEASAAPDEDMAM